MHDEWIDIWKVRKGVINMLIKRGYTTNTSCQPMTLEEFKVAYPNALTDRSTLKMIVQKEEMLAVHFFDENKLGLKILKQTLETYENQKINKLILILKESMSPACKKIIENVEVFHEAELKYNITEHVSVPEHIILNEQEKQEVLNQYKCTEDQLLYIYMHDPVCRYIGGKKGDVIKVIRNSKTANKAIVYRLVI